MRHCASPEGDAEPGRLEHGDIVGAVADADDLLQGNPFFRRNGPEKSGLPLGVDQVAEADLSKWQGMYDMNVLGALRVTRALLPALRASGRGDVLFVTSVAAQEAYPGGSGYNAAKAGEHMLARALRLELNGEKVRVIEIAPGMVHTEEFSLTRLGDQAAADKVYDGVEKPLTAEDCADVISYALNAPHHVNLDLVTVRPLAQAAAHAVARGKGV